MDMRHITFVRGKIHVFSSYNVSLVQVLFNSGFVFQVSIYFLCSARSLT